MLPLIEAFFENFYSLSMYDILKVNRFKKNGRVLLHYDGAKLGEIFH